MIIIIIIIIWVVVSDIYDVQPYWGEDEPILTHIFQMGWFNHQLVIIMPWPSWPTVQDLGRYFSTIFFAVTILPRKSFAVYMGWNITQLL